MPPPTPRQREVVWRGPPIRSWARFHRVVKQSGRPLLATLDRHHDCVLVAGCQRSGTTAVTRLLKRSPAIDGFQFGADDELDAALVLAGWAEYPFRARQCFQTTYLNDRYPEYAEHDDFRLVWLLREPRSVVRSMMYNWKRDALKRLYDDCGRSRAGARRSEWLGPSRLEKACACYAAKTEQTFALARHLGDRMLVVDYDDLVENQRALLPRLYEFLDLTFDTDSVGFLRRGGRRRGRSLSRRDAARVDELCGEVYRRARDCRTIGSDDV